MSVSNDLRQAVLQAAIQGKLTKQLPEDGNAKDFLEQIKAEKAKLIKEGKLKKEKPLPEITEDEKPFDIPENWEWVRLGEVAYIIGAGAVRSNSEQFIHGQYYYFKMNNIGNFDGECNFKDMPMINASDGEYERFKLEKGDFLFNTRNSRELVGKAAVVTDDVENVIFNNNILKIRFLNIFFAKWVCYFIISTFGRKQAGKYITSTTNVAAIYQKQMVNFLIPLPPLSEQKRIVAKVEELMAKIDELKKTEKELEALKKAFPVDMKASLLQAAMQGKLTEQLPEDGNAKDLIEQIKAEKAKLIKEGKLKKEKPLPEITEDEIPFDIPENWEWVKLNKVAFVTKLAGFEYTKDIAPNLSVDGIPIFKGKNVQNGHLVYEFEAFIPESISDRLERSQLRKPCLLTPYVGTLGNIAIFDGSFKAHLGSNVGKIEPISTNEENIELRYLLYYLLSPFGLYQLGKHSKKTAQESISIEAIRDVIIAMPPADEQKRIVEKIEKLLPLCDGLEC